MQVTFHGFLLILGAIVPRPLLNPSLAQNPSQFIHIVYVYMSMYIDHEI